MKAYNPKFNEKAFTPEEVKAGMLTEFIDFLLKQDMKAAELRDADHKYTNINIINDGYCTIVQYCEVYFNLDDPCFEFVDEGEYVATVLELPDESTVLCWNKEDAQETLDEFLKDHPYYKKNQYGRWYNVNEQKEWEEWIKENKPEYAEIFNDKEGEDK